MEILLAEFRAERFFLCRTIRLFNSFHAVLNGHRAAVEHPVIDSPALHSLQRETELLELRLLLLVLLELRVETFLLFLQIEGVVSAVKFRPSCADLNDAADDLIEEIAVVGDRQNRPPEFFNVVFQPLHTAQIQMVGRLVQQENIRLFQQQPRQIDTCFFAAGKPVKKARTHFLRNSKAVANLIRLYALLITTAHMVCVTQPVIFL